jgi:hypothetical protein
MPLTITSKTPIKKRRLKECGSSGAVLFHISKPSDEADWLRLDYLTWIVLARSSFFEVAHKEFPAYSPPTKLVKHFFARSTKRLREIVLIPVAAW